MGNKHVFTKRIAEVFIEVGTVHVKTLCSNIGFYEPKISSSLLNKLCSSNK